MRRLLCLASLWFLYGHSVVRAQEPAKVAEQHVKAAGGSSALSRIQTLALEGTFTTEDGKSGTFTLDTKLPNRYYLELLVGDQNLIEAYNGKSAWRRNAAGELGRRRNWPWLSLDTLRCAAEMPCRSSSPPPPE